MEICRICCKIWRKFPEMYETESIIRDSIHFLDSLITQDASSRTTEETDEARVSKWCLRFPLPLLESGKTGYMGKEEWLQSKSRIHWTRNQKEYQYEATTPTLQQALNAFARIAAHRHRGTSWDSWSSAGPTLCRVADSLQQFILTIYEITGRSEVGQVSHRDCFKRVVALWNQHRWQM